MIIVAGRIPIRPEMRARATAAAIKVTKATQTDAGCLQYHFYADLEDPNVLHVYEEWESEEALKAHLALPHTTEFLGAISEMVAGAPVVKEHSVSGSKDFH